MAKLISVLGCTGYVGMHLVPFLAKAAPEVRIRAAGRNAIKLHFLQQAPNVVSTHDYVHGQSLDAVMEGADACIDLSYGISGIPSEVIGQARQHGRNLADKAHGAGIAQVVIVGSVAAYGDPLIRHPWRTAPAPHELRPDTVYGRSKKAVEKAAADRARKLSVNLTILRSGHVLGPGSPMARAIAGNTLVGTPQTVDAMRAPVNATTLDGLLTTLTMLAQTPVPGVHSANHVSLETMSHDDIVAFVARQLSLTIVAAPPPPSDVDIGTRLLGMLRQRQKRVLDLQSRFGQYDLGLSAALARRMKPIAAARRWDLTTPVGGAAAPPSLYALYRCDWVPHMTDICGPPIADDDFEDSLGSVARWLTDAGYTERRS